jgi:hypothetical protein
LSNSLIGPSLLFSQIEDEYIATRENGGASAGTIRARHLVCARRDPAARLLRRHLDQRTSVWKVKEGGTAYDIYAFLTTEPNAEVGAIHPKTMPVILTRPEEVETWTTAPPDDALIARRGRRTGRRSRLILRGHLRAALSAYYKPEHFVRARGDGPISAVLKFYARQVAKKDSHLYHRHRTQAAERFGS